MPGTWLEWISSHQCTSSGWGHSSRFGDEPKHFQVGHFYFSLPLPRIFSALFSAPKFSPPSPKLQGELRNMEMQGSLELQPNGKRSSLKVRSLPSSPFSIFCFLLQRGWQKLSSSSPSHCLRRRRWQCCYCHLFFPWFVTKRTIAIIIVFFFSLSEKKKMTTLLSSFIFFVGLLWKENHGSYHRLFFFPCFVTKRMTTIAIVFLFSLLCCKEDNDSCHHLFLLIFWKEEDDNIVVVVFLFLGLLRRRQQQLLLSSSSHCLRRNRRWQ